MASKEGKVTVYYGLIGCGMMGREHLNNIALLEDTAVSVIYEPDPEMRAAAALLAPNAVFVESLGELLRHQPLDCLVITSPNHCHLDQLEMIADHVALPILVEKPLFVDPEDCPRVLRLKARYQAPIWVAMEYRYMPPLQHFINHVDDVTGGIKMLTITEHRFPFLQKVGHWNRFNKNSGGTFVEKCCHFFDLMRVMLKSDPVWIMASAGQEINHLDEVYDGQRSDIWDCGYVLVDFANGARAILELSMFAEGSEYQEMIHAVGGKGKIEVHLPGPARLWSGDPDQLPVPKIIESPRIPYALKETLYRIDEKILAAGNHNGATFHQHQRFLDVVLNKGNVDVGLDDGIWAVRMGMAAQQSATTGRAVMLTPDPIQSGLDK